MTWHCQACATVNDAPWGDGVAHASQGFCGAGNHRVTERIEWHEAENNVVQPHSYSPDLMAQGDCRTCGQVQESPVHATVLPEPAPGQMDMFA